MKRNFVAQSILLAGAFLCLSLTVVAQTAGKIRGTVKSQLNDDQSERRLPAGDADRRLRTFQH